MQATDILFWSTLAILLLAFVALFAGIGPTRKRKTPTYSDDYMAKLRRAHHQIVVEKDRPSESHVRKPLTAEQIADCERFEKGIEVDFNSGHWPRSSASEGMLRIYKQYLDKKNRGTLRAFDGPNYRPGDMSWVTRSLHKGGRTQLSAADLNRGVQLMDDEAERLRVRPPPMIRFNPPRFEQIASCQPPSGPDNGPHKTEG